MNEGISQASDNAPKPQLCGDYEDYFTPSSAGLYVGKC
jgi:hypothetical protein